MQWISEVKYQHPATRTYLGSPSLLRLFDNTLIASHDYFGQAARKITRARSFSPVFIVQKTMDSPGRK